MFDVSWTDPERELVGEHRAKKEREKMATARRSLSTQSSRSSVDSPFGFLRSKAKASLKQKPAAEPSRQAPRSLSAPLPFPSSDGASHRRSSLLANVSESFSDPLGLARTTSQLSYSQHENETVSSASSYDSRPILSRCADAGLAPDSGDKHLSRGPERTTRLVQTLGLDSYVTKQTEVSWISRDSSTNLRNVATEALISSEPDIDQHPGPSASQPNLLPSYSDGMIDSPVNLVPGAGSPRRPQCPTWSLSFKPNNPDAWKAPEEWNRMPEAPAHTTDELMEDAFTSGLNDKDPSTGLNLSAMQREVRRMAAANPEQALSRLKEVWHAAGDPSLHRQVEMEKKRWMLSTLHHLGPMPQRDTSQHSLTQVSGHRQRILALYESKVTASYLAALHLTKQVYHMSAAPLSHALYPNVYPVSVPSASPSAFPVCPSTFEMAYSLSLPAQCHSCDIPAVLRNIYRSLKKSGVLQLTLIDPLPCAGTLGPLMRLWIEEHLLLNLERRFRCMNPSKLFPYWLGEANLRGQGSTLTTAKFYAILNSARSQDKDASPSLQRARAGKETKAELRSLVGRMLWMEVWGPHVTGGSWWWDDDGCVEECIQMGTFWEYHMIEGTKDTET